MAEDATKAQTNKNSGSISVEDFCLLANSFAEGDQLEKAIQIYESACRLYPDNLALKINLGRVRSIRNQSLHAPSDIIQKSEKPMNQDLWANRYQGLGEIFLRLGKKAEAEKIFELSKASNPNFYLPYLNLGRHYLESGDIKRAIRELEQANRLNPFSEEIVDHLASALFQDRDYMESIKYAVDGLILSGEIGLSRGGRYRSKIKAMMEKLPDFTPERRNRLIHERRNFIHGMYEELEKEIGSLSGESRPTVQSEIGKIPPKLTNNDPKKAYDIAVALKKHLIFRNMDDSAVMKVARFTSEKHVPTSDVIYQEGDPVFGLYLIARGKVELQKHTPFGPIVYAAFEKGSFFGDDNLLYGRERYTNAVSVHESDLLFIDKAGLATIFAREKEIAIHFLWYFWKSLSFQIRESNERMTSFFASSAEKAKKEILKGEATGGRPTHVEIDKKLEVLQSQGLNTNELQLLAKFSNEEIYNKNEVIFREGDIGDRLYIVLSGSVLISKHISGSGEEALAMLKKGDFFGEMALIGNEHSRSADAKAQEQGTTVLVLTSSALREILSIDTDSAYQLLRILCRILSRRLQEMNEKLYQWRMMSGGFQ
jgi:CRP/FNR family transcriptional regulator, cyclic AMP receptor protein